MARSNIDAAFELRIRVHVGPSNGRADLFIDRGCRRSVQAFVANSRFAVVGG